MNRIKNYRLEDLKLTNDILNKMNKNNIRSIEDVWILKRTDLKQMGFSNEEINLIIIELELLGLDLNKKIY
ncbi:unknown [Clostridium sp. CAG:1193]|jgi:hypothetical protein|nr:unknown [Clostridium sp. CAG:1193]